MVQRIVKKKVNALTHPYHFFLCIPTETQVQTESATAEAKEIDYGNVNFSLSLGVSGVLGVFSSCVTVTVSATHSSVSGHNRKNQNQSMNG